MRRSILVWALITLAVPARLSTATEDPLRSRTFELTIDRKITFTELPNPPDGPGGRR